MMASATIDRAELPVQRNNTLRIMAIYRPLSQCREKSQTDQWQQVGAQQEGPTTFRRAAGFKARTNALINFPSISGATLSVSRPAAAKKSRASSLL
jgi:hypothetical protein